MQRETELRKWLMLIDSYVKRAEKAGRLLCSVRLRLEEGGKNILCSDSPYIRFTLRVGQPCFIETGGKRFTATYLGHDHFSSFRFQVHSFSGEPPLPWDARVIPLTEKFLSLAADNLACEASSFWTGEGSLLPAFLELIRGGSSVPWKEHAARIPAEAGISIVWGPPGTGKTTFTAHKVRELHKAGRSFIVLSSNNAALDSFSAAAAELLLNPDGISTFAKFLLSDSDKLGAYDTVIVDEVSTARIPELLVAAMAARRELLLIGDYMQLGIVADEEAERTPLEEDIFSYLSIPRDPSPECHILKVLKRQNRMRPQISSFISRNFYHGLLEDGHLEFRKYSSPLTKLFPGVMEAVDISPLWSSPSVTADSSHVNLVSAVITASLASAWARTAGLSVCVLTPYTAQSSLVRSLLTEYSVSVSTVHALQGKEADIIIFDTVDSFPMAREGKLFDEPYDEFPSPLDRFVNVALSRTREKFILISDFHFFRIHSRGSVLERLLDACTVGRNRLDRVLKYIQSPVLSFGIPGRERNARYEKEWAMRRRFFSELAASGEKSLYTFFFADSERLSRFSPSLLEKVTECGRPVSFCFRAAEHPLYSQGFSLSAGWRERHPSVSAEALPDHPYPYALTFALEERISSKGRVSVRYLWYGVLHTPPLKGRSCPIFRLRCSNALLSVLKNIR